MKNQPTKSYLMKSKVGLLTPRHLFGPYQEVCGDLVQLHQFVNYKLHSFYCTDTLYSHIFYSKDEFQIRKYHKKEQLLANRMVPNEAQYTKTPLVIFTMQEHNHLQYISNGHFDNSNRFIHIS